MCDGVGDFEGTAEERFVMTGFLSLAWKRTYEPWKRPTTPSQWPWTSPVSVCLGVSDGSLRGKSLLAVAAAAAPLSHPPATYPQSALYSLRPQPSTQLTCRNIRSSGSLATQSLTAVHFPIPPLAAKRDHLASSEGSMAGEINYTPSQETDFESRVGSDVYTTLSYISHLIIICRFRSRSATAVARPRRRRRRPPSTVARRPAASSPPPCALSTPASPPSV
jgi:hypothetical protein